MVSGMIRVFVRYANNWPCRRSGLRAFSCRFYPLLYRGYLSIVKMPSVEPLITYGSMFIFIEAEIGT